MRSQHAGDECQRERVSENLSGITERPRPACAAGPAQTMSGIRAQALASYSMLYDVARKNDAKSSFGREFAQHEIFRQIVLDSVEATDGRQRRSAGGYRRPYGELHAL